MHERLIIHAIEYKNPITKQRIFYVYSSETEQGLAFKTLQDDLTEISEDTFIKRVTLTVLLESITEQLELELGI